MATSTTAHTSTACSLTARAMATAVDARAAAHAAAGRRSCIATPITATVVETRRTQATTGERPNRTADSQASGYAIRLAVTMSTEALAVRPRAAAPWPRTSPPAA